MSRQQITRPSSLWQLETSFQTFSTTQRQIDKSHKWCFTFNTSMADCLRNDLGCKGYNGIFLTGNIQYDITGNTRNFDRGQASEGEWSRAEVVKNWLWSSVAFLRYERKPLAPQEAGRYLSQGRENNTETHTITHSTFIEIKHHHIHIKNEKQETLGLSLTASAVSLEATTACH